MPKLSVSALPVLLPMGLGGGEKAEMEMRLGKFQIFSVKTWMAIFSVPKVASIFVCALEVKMWVSWGIIMMSQIRAEPPSHKAGFLVRLHYDPRTWYLKSIQCVFSKDIRTAVVQRKPWVRMDQRQDGSSGVVEEMGDLSNYLHLIRNGIAFPGLSWPVPGTEDTTSS